MGGGLGDSACGVRSRLKLATSERLRGVLVSCVSVTISCRLPGETSATSRGRPMAVGAIIAVLLVHTPPRNAWRHAVSAGIPVGAAVCHEPW